MIEAVIPTRGKVEAVLAGLLQHHQTIDSVRIVTAAMPTSTEARRLIETWQHLGRDVTIEMQRRPGSGPARAQAIENSRADRLLFIDDDAVLVGASAVIYLQQELEKSPRVEWATPIIRFAQGFVDPPPGHTEIWERVSREDPRVVEALEHRGSGWIRVFDVTDAETDQLCGACFFANRAAMLPHREGLWRWPAGVPGNDAWLGYKLGEGRVARKIFCYHFGDFGREWDHARLHRDFMEEGLDPTWTP